MNGIFAEARLFPLQTYFKQDDYESARNLLIGFCILVLVFVIYSLIKRKQSKSMPGGTVKEQFSPRRFSVFTLYRIASEYRLNREQKRLLETVLRHGGINNPVQALNNPETTDKVFMRSIKFIERNSSSPELYEQELTKLFTLRNIIETTSISTGASVGELSEDRPVNLTAGDDTFTVKLFFSNKKGAIVEIPRRKFGTSVQLPKGSKAALIFKADTSQGFSVASKVIGNKKTEQGQGLELEFTGRPRPLAQRRFRRKQIESSCSLFLVNAASVKTGKKRTSKLVVGNRGYKGIMLDISIGGCAITTAAPLHADSIIKINVGFSGGSEVSVLGQTIRINRSATAGVIAHIKFVKIPRKAYNAINSFVFGYG
jgi:hypothetical protein